MKHYAEALTTFLFKRSWSAIFSALPDPEAGQLIKAVIAYTEGQDPELEDPVLNSIYQAMAADLDGNALRYLERSGCFSDK